VTIAPSSEPLFTFIVPGPIDQVTGGYIFDRRLVETLRAGGRRVDVVELPGQFPFPDERALQAAGAALAGLPEGSLVVVDGLALPAFERALEQHGSRLRVVCFVHHPLSLETGLDAPEREHLAAIEARLWSMMSGIVCPSSESAEAVVQAGVTRARVAVAPPGTDAVAAGLAASAGSHIRDAAHAGGAYVGSEHANGAHADGVSPVVVEPVREAPGPVRLLAVGTLVARKGYGLLVEALSELPDRLDWRLDCIGSLDRCATTVEQVRMLVRERGLGKRVTLHGEVAQEVRDHAYAQADVFVLPSYHEGYGMVFAEAMAWGLPIIATTGGAIPQTVPADAGWLVAPGDRSALVKALGTLISDRELRARMAVAARAAASALPDWQAASAHWFNCVERLAR
jgi:glycosyltransferase involved in cell wall biosynthesis